MPKYCKKCKLQGHDENDCYVLHPELYPKEEKVVEGDKDKVKGGTEQQTEAEGEFKE